MAERASRCVYRRASVYLAQHAAHRVSSRFAARLLLARRIFPAYL